jgi:hypothetical protein
MEGHKHGGKGQSYGKDREYQVLASKIISRLKECEELSPLDKDGIDVPQDLGGTTWTFDVLMLNQKDETIVVVECKNWGKPMEQENIAAFAYLVGLLKNKYGKTVRAYYFTKKGYRSGALKAAKYVGINLIISEANLNLDETFSIYIREFDNALNGPKQHVIIQIGAPLELEVQARPAT